MTIETEKISHLERKLLKLNTALSKIFGRPDNFPISLELKCGQPLTQEHLAKIVDKMQLLVECASDGNNYGKIRGLMIGINILSEDFGILAGKPPKDIPFVQKIEKRDNPNGIFLISAEQEFLRVFKKALSECKAMDHGQKRQFINTKLKDFISTLEQKELILTERVTMERMFSSNGQGRG